MAAKSEKKCSMFDIKVVYDALFGLLQYFTLCSVKCFVVQLKMVCMKIKYNEIMFMCNNMIKCSYTVRARIDQEHNKANLEA